MYVYVAASNEGEWHAILDIFKDYEKARDFVIEKANSSIIHREDFMYVEKICESEGETCIYSVRFNEDDAEEASFYVFKKELL